MKKLRKFFLISLCVTAAILFIYFIAVEWEEEIKQIVKDMGPWAPIGIFILRGISTIFPVIPNLPYSILAGNVLNFKIAYLTIFLSDFVFCQIAFLIARKLGREPVRKLVGIQAMKKIESFNENQLEGNFFLMTGVLMTGLFDYVSYALGLGGTKWRIFTFSIFLCLIIFDAVAVAIGAGLAQKIYLLYAMLGMFGLAVISGLVKKRITISN